jgi:hypothetical protein
MPRTMTQSQVVQATSDRHHQVAHRRLPVAQLVLHDPTALHTAHHVLDPHLLARYTMILSLLLNCQLSTTRFLCWLLNQNVLKRKSLKSHVLVQHTPSRKGIHFIVHYRFLMPFSSNCLTQKPDLTVSIDQHNILDCVTLLLATVIFILFVSIYWTLDGAFGTIMIKKGMPSSSELSFSVISLARRAGMVSRSCKA